MAVRKMVHRPEIIVIEDEENSKYSLSYLNMAVKNPSLVHDNCNQPEITVLVQYIQLMNEQPNYLPPPHELIKSCQDIVKYLAHISGDEEQLWEVLLLVEEIFVRIMTSVPCHLRQELITAILDKFYLYISDPQSDVSPAMSAVLIVLNGSGSESTLSSAHWLVQQGGNGPAEAGLRSSLSCMYRWMYEWHATPALGDWLLAYIQAMEENERFDILIEVTIDNLGQLFCIMNQPAALQDSVADVIFHILASVRESIEALDRIAPHVEDVLTNLAEDSGQWSRKLLQNVIDIMVVMVDRLMEPLKAEALEAFKDKFACVLFYLESHMASHSCRFLSLPPWRARTVCLTSAHINAPLPKVGLLNLGNTCYMNSVIQALLATRIFSNHVVLQMTSAPYWAKLGVLFVKMTHSISTKLSPREFLSVVKSPFFTRGLQHDSSEFLGYLFELLRSFEHESEHNFNYSRPPVLPELNRFNNFEQSHSDDNEQPESSYNLRTHSPRPGSSKAGGSNSLKRTLPMHETRSKKRKRLTASAFIQRSSFVDSTFSGVLVTRMECNECRSSSISRDIFIDLTLAFSNRPEGRQYSVQNLLEFYCSNERLSGENRYLCHYCGGLHDAERSVLIEKAPKILILVLKNFKFDTKLQVQAKLMNSTFYNHTIMLPTVRSQSDHSTYNLYASIIHIGTTLDAGHYYTFAKDNDQWYMYDDDVVTRANENHLQELNATCTPYVLFYRRTDVEEGTAPRLEDLPPKLQEEVMAHNKHCEEMVRKMRHARP